MHELPGRIIAANLICSALFLPAVTSKGHMRQALLTVVMLVLMVTLSDSSAGGEGQPFIAQVNSDGVQRAAIVGGNYFFRPSHIIVKINKPVELSVRKDGWLVPHNFIIDAPEAGISVDESLDTDPKRITFVPTKTGIYSYYCDKKLLLMDSHRVKEWRVSWK